MVLSVLSIVRSGTRQSLARLTQFTLVPRNTGILMAFALGLTLAAGARAETILIIESYSPDYQWDADYIQAIQDELGKEHKIEVTYLNTKKIAKSEFEASADQAMEVFKRVKPDLVVLGDDNANTYMIPRLHESKVPVVFLGVNSPVSKLNLDKYKHVTGVLERPLYERTIKHIRKVLKPMPNKLLVLMDNSPTMQAAVGEKFGSQRTAVISNIRLDFVLTNDADEWRDTVSSAKEKGYQAIVFGTFHTIRESNDDYAQPDSLIGWANKNTEVPMFAFWDLAIGKGKAAGGYVVSGYDQGRIAARVSHFILKGVPVSQINPFVGDIGRYVYSKTEMEKWQLKLNKVASSQAFYTD